MENAKKFCVLEFNALTLWYTMLPIWPLPSFQQRYWHIYQQTSLKHS